MLAFYHWLLLGSDYLWDTQGHNVVRTVYVENSGAFYDASLDRRPCLSTSPADPQIRRGTSTQDAHLKVTNLSQFLNRSDFKDVAQLQL